MILKSDELVSPNILYGLETLYRVYAPSIEPGAEELTLPDWYLEIAETSVPEEVGYVIQFNSLVYDFRNSNLFRIENGRVPQSFVALSDLAGDSKIEGLENLLEELRIAKARHGGQGFEDIVLPRINRVVSTSVHNSPALGDAFERILQRYDGAIERLRTYDREYFSGHPKWWFVLMGKRGGCPMVDGPYISPVRPALR